MCYGTVVEIGSSRMPEMDMEITVFTTIFQAVGYLVMMAVANVFYYLGPLSELLLKPNRPDRYRKIMFGMGYWFSFALPFTIPAMLLILVLTQPKWWTG